MAESEHITARQDCWEDRAALEAASKMASQSGKLTQIGSILTATGTFVCKNLEDKDKEK